MNDQTQATVRVTASKGGPDGYVTISGLNSEEFDKIQGAVRGHSWMRGEGGRLNFSPAHEPPPSPTEDHMLPQWRSPVKGEGNERYQAELFEPVVEWKNQSPSILIQHLCGYGYTPESYKENAEMLEECGFSCMRSIRGDYGQFREIWFLPGLWAARGRLKEALHGKSKAHEMRFALKFLRERTSWGTLDSAVQRFCQVLE